nr:HAMP domain-containing sensor histidine kinase [Prolixibacteraceae bacterium]
LQENFKIWNEKQKLEMIREVHNASTKLYQLLENLLHWSRSQSGIIDFNPQKIELKETFNNVVDLMKGAAEAKSIELAYELPEVGLTVLADLQMLDTIMRNLISNALKFTNVGGKVLVVAESNLENVNIKIIDNEFIDIKVIDNGVGIGPEVKDKLFRIDSNLSTSGTSNEKGTGLGLILVKEFVIRHGGSIGVDSTIGKGSTFYFTLPMAKE